MISQTALRGPSAMPETGDWSEDNARGRAAARELIEAIRRDGAPNYLGTALKRLAESDRWGGVEVGFAAALGAEILQD